MPTGSITQFSSTSGNTTVNNMQQNGYAAGQLQTIQVGTNGTITGTFSNGQNVPLAEVPLVHFNSPNNLKALDGGAYAGNAGLRHRADRRLRNRSSGNRWKAPTPTSPTEFTKLIVTQQAYSANTKVITTANQMSQDLLNILRYGRRDARRGE